MSYPNLGGYNAAQMSYGGGGGPPPAGYGSGQPGGYAGHGGNYGSEHGGFNSGGYPPSAAPSNINPEIQQWFNAVDRDRSGKITATELKAALVTGQGKNFSDEACKLMIGMFDRDKTGTIDINEFQQLYNYVNQWLATFRTYDRDQSGTVEGPELTQAFQQMGFRFSPEFIKFLLAKSDIQNHAKISVDQFIVLCVQIQRFTENGIDPSIDYHFDKAKRRRRPEEEDDGGSHNGLDLGIHSKMKVPNTEDKLLEEIFRMKEEMNQLINENVHLLKENKQLQEDNGRLEDRMRNLHEENERLRKEHRDAIELTSWLSSAREIVQTLQKKPVILTKPGKKSVTQPFESGPKTRSSLQPSSTRPSSLSCDQIRTMQWEETVSANSNGSFTTLPIKQERCDENSQKELGDESPYHTPLLNFDQVDFHSSGREENNTHLNSLPDMMTVTEPVDDDVDRVGREQLLFPEPIEGVCELCPGSRIYVALSALDNILSKKSHSSVARSCLEAIFKMPFLLSCSVQGNVAKGPYGKPDVQRPSLYKPAVECILKYARYHAEQNGWKVEENTTIKKQMNTRLSELRNIAKYKAASAEGGDAEHKSYSRYKNIVAALSAVPIVAQTSETSTETESRPAKEPNTMVGPSDPTESS